MSLPTPESLLVASLDLQRTLTLLEAELFNARFEVARSDNTIVAIATGLVEMASVTIAPSEVELDASELASRVFEVCREALARANAHGSAEASAAAPGYTLPDVPDAGAPPPTDLDFDRIVGGILAEAPCLMDAISRRTFEGVDGGVRAVVNGSLDLLSLAYESPVPNDAALLAAATFTSINLAINRARTLVPDAIGGTVDATFAVWHRVKVYVGYLDNDHGAPDPADLPVPFDDASVLISSGGVDTPHDTGVIRFANHTHFPVTIDPGLQVTTAEGTFQIWDRFLPIQLLPGQDAVFAETENFNFDSSDAGLGCAPVVSGSIDGRMFLFVDTGRVLLGREEGAKQGLNETTPYSELRNDVPRTSAT